MKLVKISVLTSLYRCERYLNGYFKHLAEIPDRQDVEVLLLHNEPTPAELAIVRENMRVLKDLVRHIVVQERESYYRSLNRGIRLARGEYIALWNVDDVRLPGSLRDQGTTLDQYSAVGLTYGDIVEVSEYGRSEGEFHRQPEYENKPTEFLRSYFGGCFPMWRKSVHDLVGYFDEQLKSAGDFDFWVRVARSCRLKKTKALLGYYLNEETGLSTSGWLQAAERTVIELRYAQFDKINYLGLVKAFRYYSVFRIFADGAEYSVAAFFPGHHAYFIRRLPLFFLGMIEYPLSFLLPNVVLIIPRLITLGPRKLMQKITRKTGITF